MINIKQNHERRINLNLDFTQSLMNPAGFCDPTYPSHSKPLPMVAYINGKVTPEQFLMVAQEGAVPVFHRGNNTKIGQRRKLALAAAMRAIEDMRFDWETL